MLVSVVYACSCVVTCYRSLEDLRHVHYRMKMHCREREISSYWLGLNNE